MSSKTVVINMLKTDMDSIIDVPLPQGYSLRRYRQGDRQVWADMYDKLDDHYKVTTQVFDDSFGDDHELISRSMVFLCHEEKEIGTITAWPEENIGGVKTSRLHWAGINKDYRGRHLGAALVSYILKHMRDRGCKACVLGTNEKRIEALNMYFDFGFLPSVYTDKYSPLQDQKESWLRVKQIIRDEHKDKI